jgi:primosomal protein N' (replication factor Y)
MLHYPPFSRIARIVVTAPQPDPAKSVIQDIANLIRHNSEKITLLGPAPAVMAKIKDRHRFSLLLKCDSPRLVQQALQQVRVFCKKLKKDMQCSIDVDPYSML